MRLALLVAPVIGAGFLLGCQPAAPPPAEAPSAAVVEAPAEAATPAATPAPALPCGILAQRDWQARASGPTSLTVSGEIDLGASGYGVSLARDASEAQGATTAKLTLQLRPPTGPHTEVVTPHPVRYFGPARAPYENVEIVCDGVQLTTITVTR